MTTSWRIAPAVALLLASIAPEKALAHCDGLDGPVATAARKALDGRDLKPLLMWVRVQHEGELRDAFGKTLAVRTVNPQSRELADTWFLETAVRLHRAGEGAPFTGLKPAGSDPGPAIRAADKALESGSADALVGLLTTELAQDLRARFDKARAAKLGAGESVETGREYVAAYVEFMHYVEARQRKATATAPHEH